MPNRPRQHVLEDLARADLHRAFAEQGWTVEDLSKDYGEDMLVRIFTRGDATPLSLFVQSKSTDSFRTVRNNEREVVPVTVSTNHIEHWRLFWQPVVLTIYDARASCSYWEVVQDALPAKAASAIKLTQKSITIDIPLTNKVDEDGLRRLRNRTIKRFARFEAQKEGARILVDQLKRAIGLEIEYNPETGFLILPAGTFIPAPERGRSVIAFGRGASKLQELMAMTGQTPEAVITESLRLSKEVCSAIDAGGLYQVREKDGQIINKWTTIQGFLAYIKATEEDSDEA